MKRIHHLIFVIMLMPAFSMAQDYRDSMKQYFRDYVKNHEVVSDKNKKFMKFFHADPAFRVMARFERKENSRWVPFNTSAGTRRNYRVFGTLHFSLEGKTYSLNVYQSQDLVLMAEYQDYLFLPFTDSTNGNETYEAGRYIDLKMTDIAGNSVIIDFNKSYNPYCAYESGYQCPVPPAENHLKTWVRAGEKKFVPEENIHE